MKKYIKVLPLFLFALFIFGLSLVDVVTPDHSFSEMENRYLEEFPPPTVDTLMSGQFTEDYETYLSDQFVGRPQWISAKSLGETLLLKKENNNIVYGHNGYLFDKVVTIDEKRLASNLEFVQEFAQLYPDLPITFGLVPSSSTIYPDYLPTGLGLVDELPYIQQAYSQVEEEMDVVNIGDALVEARNLYPDLYYHTDHHWNYLGAQVAFRTFMDQPLDTPEISTDTLQAVPNFYGTYFSKAKKIGTQPDTIYYQEVPGLLSVVVDGEEKNTLHDLEQFSKRDKYAGLVWGNNGVTTLQRQPSADSKGHLLLVKDSYGNTIAPLFLEDYDQVTMIDLRYIAGLETVGNLSQFDDILILYSFSNFTTDTNVIKLLPNT